MQRVKIAIIDNGIDASFLSYQLAGAFAIDQKGQCVTDDTDMSQVDFIHGTTCAAVIQSHLPDAQLYSLRILDRRGKGLVEHLKPALEWCLENKIWLVNLSLGATHFKDKGWIRSLINRYANQGMCMVAATSNQGCETYPASFSNVIGVAAHGMFHADFSKCRYLKIDALAKAEHHIAFGGGGEYVTQKSNSYAAPYVTACIGRLFLEKKLPNVRKIKYTLSKGDQNISALPWEEWEPDWMSRALLWLRKGKSNAEYYFDVVEEEERELADTVIVDSLTGLSSALALKKHIVYLGGQKAEAEITDRFFWSPHMRMEFIQKCAGTKKEPDIPVIVCRFDAGLDEMFLLTEIKKSFAEQDYNMYTVSLNAEGVLYGLEYIPETCLGESDRVREYLCRKTDCRQSDGIVIGLEIEKAVPFECLGNEIDLTVWITKEKGGYELNLYCGEGTTPLRMDTAEINACFIRNMTDHLIRSLTED